MHNFMKIRPLGVELFRADRQRDMTKPVVAFCNFGNVTKIINVQLRLKIHVRSYTGLFEMIVGVLTTCHIQRT